MLDWQRQSEQRCRHRLRQRQSLRKVMLHTGEGGEAAETAAAAKAKPKAKPKPKPTSDSKGSSKGKGQDDTAKPDSKGKGSKGDGKAKAKPKPDAPSVPSIFWPKGTCNSRSSCPFYHHPKAAPKAAATKSAPNPTGSAPGGCQVPPRQPRQLWPQLLQGRRPRRRL